MFLPTPLYSSLGEISVKFLAEPGARQGKKAFRTCFRKNISSYVSFSPEQREKLETFPVKFAILRIRYH